MNDYILSALLAIVGIIAGAAGAIAFKRLRDEKTKKGAEDEAERILGKARAEAQRIDRDSKNRAKDFEARARRTAENDIQKQKQKLVQEEKQLQDKDARLEKEFQNKQGELEARLQEIASRDEKIKIAEKRVAELELDAQKKQEELKARIEAASGLSAAEAKREMVDALTADARAEAAKRAIEIEEEAKVEADAKAKRIIAMSIARFASEFTAERTVSVINLPNEDMKGKIIGREGRNIRALEAACGVDLIVDETPEAVVISSFDPVRREIARKALERLMEDGRVHPARIEEVIEKVKKEIMKVMKEDGEKAVFELGLAGIHPEIIKVLGSLKFRQTMAQNLLQHSIEVGFLCGIMASELGIDVKRARRAGVLHAIGLGVDHTIEGSYAVVGAEFLKKYGESEQICHAVRSHREDEKPTSVLAFLVQAANAISTSRPGARRQSMDSYIRRMEDMESIGNSFDGVVRTFAVQTGKELRVLVESSRVTDEQASMLSYDIARKIERELSYAGQVKVSVVREVRVVEHAR